jgi:putative ABC transport system substrate-binding protein
LDFVKEFAHANNFLITLYDARELEKLKGVLSQVPQSDPDVLVVLNDPFVFTYRKVIVEAANQIQLPAAYGFRECVDDGGLISYGSAITDTYRRAARYVDQILKGVNPANLPVQLPTKFELVVNMRTAKVLGVTISNQMQLLADEVIA